MKNGILIDSKNQSIKSVELGNDYKEIYKHLECQIFTCVDINEQNTIFVDDEGLLSLTPNSMFFQYEGYPQPLCGNGLILGIDNEGESIDTTLSVEYIKSKVKFLNLYQVQRQFS